MQVCHSIHEIRQFVRDARSVNQRVGFVPTMGALHTGHTSLIDASVADRCTTVVSIYVNPTQFAAGEDLDKYPRTLDNDLALCRKHGAAAVFVPSTDDIYPPGDQTRVRVGPLAETLCGPFRPGHFEGVCTVVARLFHIVEPNRAYFGQKDGQQCAVIRRMVADLHIPVEVVVRDTVREPDGLAMSSRNRYLSPTERQQAASIYAALKCGEMMIRSNERCSGKIISQMCRIVNNAGPVRMEYVSIVDAAGLQDVHEVDGRVMLAIAVRIGGTRLIDNVIVDPAQD